MSLSGEVLFKGREPACSFFTMALSLFAVDFYKDQLMTPLDHFFDCPKSF